MEKPTHEVVGTELKVSCALASRLLAEYDVDCSKLRSVKSFCRKLAKAIIKFNSPQCIPHRKRRDMTDRQKATS